MHALNLGCGHDVQRWQPCLRAGIVYLVPDSIQDFCGGRMEWSVYTCGLHRTNAPSSVIAHWSGAPSHGVMVPSKCRGQASVQVTRSSLVRWYIAHRCVVSLGIRCFQKRMNGSAGVRRCAFGSASMTSCVTRRARSRNRLSQIHQRQHSVGYTDVACSHTPGLPDNRTKRHGSWVCDWRMSKLAQFLLSELKTGR
jgi:hypothetical protein